VTVDENKDELLVDDIDNVDPENLVTHLDGFENQNFMIEENWMEWLSDSSLPF